MALSLALLGCDLPSIPKNLNPPPALPDMAGGDMDEPLLCSPGSRGCFASSVRVCDEDGRSFSIEVCPANEVCRDGDCVDATETCEDDDVSVAISQTRIFFDVNEDLKPASTQLSLTNCENTPLRVQKASIVSPVREDGAFVFDFDISTGAPQGLTIDPGVSVDSKIVFRPRDIEWIERGTMYLTIEGGADVITREVEMLSTSWCLTMTPSISLGEMNLDEEVKREVMVHNCGTRSILLSGAQLQHDDADLEWSIEGLERPRTLQPGQQLPLNVAFIPRQTGRFDAEVELVLNPREESNLGRSLLPTSLRGEVFDPMLDCRDVEVGAPSLEPLTRGADREQVLVIYSITSDEIPDEDWFAHHSVRALDDFGVPPSIQPSRTNNVSLWLPYTVGAYELVTRFADPEGAPSCETNVVKFDARDAFAHHVELVWYSPEDPIREDEGAAYGVDLDLHARFVYEDGERGAWNTTGDRGGCFGEPGVCAAGLAEVLSVSDSGGWPESLAVNADLEDGVTHLDLGVHLVNSHIFTTSCASLRIWRGEELVAAIPSGDDSAAGCPSGRTIQGTDSFWYIGRLSLADGTLDQSEQAVFPRGIPRD